MPSASSKQHRFMSAVAHNPTFAKKVGIPQSVGEDFSAADKKKFGRRGSTNINSKETDMKNMRPSNLGRARRMPMRPTGTRVPAMPGMKKGGMPMKDGKPAFMQKKMMGGGMAKYAKGGGIESRGKTRGTVVRMASGGSVSSRADGIAQRGKTKFKTY